MNLAVKLVLAVGVLISFYVGYAASASAWPGVPDRSAWHGYFKNGYQNTGWDVIPGGLPDYVNNAETFISFIKFKLSAGPGSQNGVGAAFIIQTMIGLSRNQPPTAAEIAEWESRVRYADAHAMVNWTYMTNYAVNSYYQPAWVDNAFFYENATAPSVLFRNSSGAIVYAIRRECVNPVGTLTALDDAPSYTISGRSTVSDDTVYPGQRITFNHYLRNSGPNSVSNVYWTARNVPANAILRDGWTGIAAGAEITVATIPFTVPAGAPAGTTYCQYVAHNPLNELGGGGVGATVCARVINDFQLTPTVDAGGVTTAQQGDSITFRYLVLNGGPASSDSVNCTPIGGTKPPGYTPLPQDAVARTADPGFTAPPTNCPRTFPIGQTEVASETVNVTAAFPPGTRICRALVVNPHDENGGPLTSADTCVIIAKAPYVHFMGNDVWAGGGFAAVNPACNASAKITTTARTLSDGSVAGSATEYGAFALGKITNFGSANKGLADPAGVAGKVLTFSNFDSNNLGFYGATRHCVTDYVDKYASTPVSAQPPAINVGAGANEVVRTTGAHSFAGALPAGRQKVYLVEGDVTITGNITYPGTYGGLSDIPSLIIIATGNITVASGVTQMDGLFVSRGTFATCDPAPGNLSISICNNQLVINGAVIANRLSLLRTHGADGATPASRKVPAEVFNFNAELYLRNALTNTNGVILRTVNQKDLPPRF